MAKKGFRCLHVSYAIVAISFLFFGCGISSPVIFNPVKKDTTPMKLAIFLDGTTNSESSYTNVSKLYNLTTLQNNPNISAVYLRGVGNGADILGIVTGSGIKREVCNAYLYLAEHYNHQRNDEIYIFGFSRGAYAARILAGLIYVAGIVDVKDIPENKRLKFIRKIYEAHKSDKDIKERRESIFKVTKQSINPEDYKIEFMGLWDTVEALGIPKYEEEYYTPKNKYVDQLCNIKKVSHALSLNDSRSSVFTPVLFTHGALVSLCPEVNPKNIANEVWFFGNHSDVGGGARNTHISGVSLNWMISELKSYNLLPENTSVYENSLDITNDIRKGFYRLLFPKKERKLSSLASINGYKKDKLKIHTSVLERLKTSLKTYEINLIKLFSECFDKNEIGGYDYIKKSDCFTVIE